MHVGSIRILGIQAKMMVMALSWLTNSLLLVKLGLYLLQLELLMNLLVIETLLDVSLVQLEDELLLELDLFAL